MIPRPLLLLALLFSASTSLAFAAPAPAPDHVSPPADQAAPDAAWLAQAKANYPLKTCVVSEEEIGGMGEGIDYIYQQKGQPDRLVRFCCQDCRHDFDKDPAQYLKAIDAAAAQAKKN